jgi:hypothetical protein
MGPVFRFGRNPMLRLFLSRKITDVGIRAIARNYRNEPPAALGHFGTKFRPFSHPANMPRRPSLFQPGSLPQSSSRTTRFHPGLDKPRWRAVRWSQSTDFAARKTRATSGLPRVVERPSGDPRNGHDRCGQNSRAPASLTVGSNLSKLTEGDFLQSSFVSKQPGLLKGYETLRSPRHDTRFGQCSFGNFPVLIDFGHSRRLSVAQLICRHSADTRASISRSFFDRAIEGGGGVRRRDAAPNDLAGPAVQQHGAAAEPGNAPVRRQEDCRGNETASQHDRGRNAHVRAQYREVRVPTAPVRYASNA